MAEAPTIVPSTQRREYELAGAVTALEALWGISPPASGRTTPIAAPERREHELAAAVTALELALGVSPPAQTATTTAYPPLERREHDIALAVSALEGLTTSPASLSGLVAWVVGNGTLWQDSARTVPAVADADPVGAWDDASGAAHHALQAVAVSRPTLHLAALNGRPVLRFDGVDDWLRTATFAQALAQPSTTFMVMQQSNLAGGIDYYASDSATVAQLRVAGARTIGASAGTNLTGPAVNDTSPHVFSVGFAGVASGLWRDGVSLAAGDAGANALTGLTIGAGPGVIPGFYLPGDVAELIIYSRTLSNAERRSIEAYLGTKYAIAMT